MQRNSCYLRAKQVIMNQVNIAELYRRVKEFCEHDTTGHDWWHVQRVTQLALHLAKYEGANLQLVEPAALVHDTDDWKLKGEEGYPNATKMLAAVGYSSKQIDLILEIVEQVSYRGAGVDTTPRSIEAMVVQDADRLDAIGAIGIARAFAYGGSKHRPMFLPHLKPQLHETFEEYKAAQGHTIKHFYEKLLLLKNRMNTVTAKILAEERHRFMEVFLEHFFKEWNFRP